jgi:hypothetical protein
MEAGTSDALKFHIPQGLSFLLLWQQLSSALFPAHRLQIIDMHSVKITEYN